MIRRAAPAGGALLLAALLAVSGDARAAEDGGARSVFATGAGNRALSLGGAYVALSDDASAAVWNPGGLGFLRRGMLQVSHASVGVVDLDEQYASVAIPSWRWGAAALSFRRLAVDGIEARDDRNLLLAGDLDDSESELKLAYGRSSGEAWSLGGAFKLRRQSLAGFSASAIGLDIGAVARPGLLLGRDAPWASRLTVGAVARNVVEPKLRLDREEVADPATVQFGAAYRRSFGGSVEALALLDLEKSSATNWMPRAGAEATILEVLALRGGWNSSSWTAGAGIAWRGIQVDYAIEDTELDVVHRLGLGYAFGRSVEESRALSLQREEDDFRARLADTFERRQKDRIDELLKGATASLEAEDFDAALEVLAAVLALEPGNAEALALQVRGYKRQGASYEASGDFASASIAYGRALAAAPDDAEAAKGADRCRAESAKRTERTQQIRGLFDAALGALSAGDLRAAQENLRALLEVAPDDAEAKTLLRRTRVAIDARARDLFEQARRVLDAGLSAEAERLADEIRRLDPQARGLTDLASRIRAAEAAQAAAKSREPANGTPGAGAAPPPANLAEARPAPKPAAISRKKRKDLADLYKRGMEAMQDGRTDDALRYWELVWLGDPEYEGVADHLKREYLLRGLESFSRGGLDEAILLWEKALAVDPKDGKTISYLARAREQLARSREILGTKP